MELGLGLPQRGGVDLSTDVVAVAQAAEQAGYLGLWTYDRLLVPAEPTQGMYGVPGLPWAPVYHHTADALTLLAAAAAVTERIQLGTGVAVAPLYIPTHLAKMLATVDALSGGRLVAGLGSGWSVDEYRASGVPIGQRGALLEETLDVLDAAWGPDPVSYRGQRVTLDKAIFGPKPVNRIPVLLAGWSAPTLQRVARRADGWLATYLPPEAIGQSWDGIRQQAAGLGRDASAMRLVVRAVVMPTPQPLGQDRQPFSGSIGQIVQDLAAHAAVGADEVLVELQAAEPYPGTQWLIETAEEIVTTYHAARV